MTTRKIVPLVVAAALVLYAPLFLLSIHVGLTHPDGVLINDVSRLHPTYVKAIVKNHELEGLQETLAMARDQHLNVSIAGNRHSMGGHTFYPGAVVMDMTDFNQILRIDAQNKTVTAQSGATWRDVIAAINPYHLSIEVMQAYNGFTLGGSLSVNVHESDPNFGPLVESVESFRLLLANGTILDVSRSQNPELFSLVIGGYGMFGVILDVTLHVTDDAIYHKSERVIDYTQYPAFFRNETQKQQLGQIFARLSIAKDDTLLKEMVVTTYSHDDSTDASLHDLQGSNIALKKFVFGLSRDFDWGKQLRWYLQKEKSDLVDPPIISRNNLMDGDVSFLDYGYSKDTDILQEYFIPYDQLPAFIDDLRAVVRAHDINLLSATIRYLPVNTESVMSYSAKEEFGVVLYFNVGTSAAAQAGVQAWTRELLDHALEKGGTYYLPYVMYASRDEFRQAYPHADAFFAKKKEYDPQLLFRSNFYETYA